MSKHRRESQGELWLRTDAVASGPGHPFYVRLNALLAEDDFDDFVESLCAPFYAKKKGRPSIRPGVYFRMLFIGFFERLDSEQTRMGIVTFGRTERVIARVGATPDTLMKALDRLPPRPERSGTYFYGAIIASNPSPSSRTIW